MGFLLCNRYAVVIFCLLLKPAAALHTLDSKAYLRRTFEQPIPGPFPDPLVSLEKGCIEMPHPSETFHGWRLG